MVLFGGGAEMIEHDSRLNPRNAAGGVDFENSRHVFREIENDGNIAALAGKRRAGAAAKKRSSELATKRYGCDDVFVRAGENDTDWNLAIVRTVGGIEGARTGVETDFSANIFFQSGRQTGSIHFDGFCGVGEFCEPVWHAADHSNAETDSGSLKYFFRRSLALLVETRELRDDAL
jgi:hypothetical protein